MNDPELTALRVLDESLAQLDEQSRQRVLNWAWSKYGMGTTQSKTLHIDPYNSATPDAVRIQGSNEIPGIARLTDNGEFKLTIRDVKAKSTNDAAIRLAHIVIYAYGLLTGEESISSRNMLSPILKKWRAYSGNTRNILSQHKGIIRDGDRLSLDAHSKKEAEDYINQVLDDSIKGAWNPTGNRRPRRKNI